MGTSTKTVFHRAMAPFQRPGSSCASNSRPPSDLREIKPVAGSTNSCRSKTTSFRYGRQTRSTGLKWVAKRINSAFSGAIWFDSASLGVSNPSAPVTQKGPPPELRLRCAPCRTRRSGGRAPAQKEPCRNLGSFTQEFILDERGDGLQLGTRHLEGHEVFKKLLLQCEQHPASAFL